MTQQKFANNYDTIQQVTQLIIQRSHKTRQQYLQRMQSAWQNSPPRKKLSCGNLAHTVAACSAAAKNTISSTNNANLGIVTAYNDMLSAHQPYQYYPERIKKTAQGLDCTAQVAGGVPAMCDGVTQGQIGMELSLFSRDVIAMATAVSLSHNVFDGNIFLGICDKIVPGLFIGAMEFGHIPSIFIPAGPMTSGISNHEKAAARQEYAQGKIDRSQMLAVESSSYHSPGTCTFYGTANTNQLLMEFMGLHVPGAAFVNTETPLRHKLTESAVETLIANTSTNGRYKPLYEIVTEQSFVNAIVGLLATGGSTNLSLHLIVMAKACGIQITWQDFDQLSAVVPLLARVYPNGQADVNHFQHAGGTAYLIHELRRAKLLNENVITVVGEGLEAYEFTPELNSVDKLHWPNKQEQSDDLTVLATIENPYSDVGGLRVVSGNIGSAIVKTSAVKEQFHSIKAPCFVVNSQQELQTAFDNGELNRDLVVVVRFQGPSANGMPELHKLMPILGSLQDQGLRVALVTDGRLSGASGKVLAAIHLTPEAKNGGILSKLEDGDIISINAETGNIDVELSEQALNSRESVVFEAQETTLGRHLFENFRASVSSADAGADVFGF